LLAHAVSRIRNGDRQDISENGSRLFKRHTVFTDIPGYLPFIPLENKSHIPGHDHGKAPGPFGPDDLTEVAELSLENVAI